MKKTILATIAFAFATMPLTFAAQTPANPPASGSQSNSSATTTKKSHKKAAHKTAKKSTATPAPAGSGK